MAGAAPPDPLPAQLPGLAQAPTRRLLTATVRGRWSRSWLLAQWVGNVSVVSRYQLLAVAADSDSRRSGSW